MNTDDTQFSPTELRIRFDLLVHQWKLDTMISSSSTEIIMHDAYQRVIGLGEQAIPLILEEMQAGHLHWGAAMHAITNQSPDAEAKNPQQSTDAWLGWGRGKGWLPT